MIKSLKNNNKGQIMVITLLVLTIITVIVVSVILIASKDVEQQTTTKEYERYLDRAEQAIIGTIYAFGSPEYDLSEIISDPSLVDENASCSMSGKGITCTIVDNDNISQVTMTIEDNKDIEDYTLQKDELFTMYLGGYRNLLRVDWTGQTAMTFTLGFRRGGEYMSISDVFDPLGVMTTHGNDPLNDSPPENHVLAFRPYLGTVQTSTEFVVGDTTGLQPGDELINLSFRPIMREDGYTLLTVRATGVIDDQMRVYEATGYALDVDQFGTTPAPTVITKIPLYPQVPSIFDYVLLTPSNIEKLGTGS
ncbi:hypothetical protein JW796_00930 [Candidatus Dojkabacteria bacterium]|nr:hypothetical protein [Candidatus Dojkabacteria bacterium]